MSASSQARIIKVLQQLLSERSISALPDLDANLLEFGLNSLDMINLVLSIEAEFDVSIPESAITSENLLSVVGLSGLIDQLQET